MNYLREAFKKIKEDIGYLKEEISFLKLNINENSRKINQFPEILEIIKEIDKKMDYFKQNNQTDRQTDTSTEKEFIPAFPTHSSTQNTVFKPLNTGILPFSTGNEGASTDRQTDTSTDRQTEFSVNNNKSIKNALEFLNSLDNIKKEIRLKFKRITNQEFLVFSTIYQMDEEYGGTDYKALSKKLNLTESSIRDYVGRLLKKEIPIEKIKINNKNIQLLISKDLKKIASLPTILQLRDI